MIKFNNLKKKYIVFCFFYQEPQNKHKISLIKTPAVDFSLII